MKNIYLFLLFCFSFTLVNAQVNLSQGLLAYYPFTGNANDVSGNNNNPSFNNATLTNDRFGNTNSAYHFDGTDTYMRIPNAPTLNLGNSMSICVMVKPMGFYTGPCYNNMIICKEIADYQTGNYSLRFADFVGGCSPTPITTDEQFGSEPDGGLPTITPIQLNQWYTVVYTSDGTTAKLYVNCQLASTSPATVSAYSNVHDLLLGHLDNPAFPYWLNGDLDEVRLYNRAINQDEVNAYGSCISTCTQTFSTIDTTICLGQSFNGHATTGTYVDTLLNVQGCDSLRTVNLTVNNCAPISCNSWLRTTVEPDYVTVGDLGVSGNQLTIEGMFNRVAPVPGNDYHSAGDIISKHTDQGNCNYYLRPGYGAIATTNGYFETPQTCPFELNKTYHVAIVYDGSLLKFYRDGVLMSQTAATGNLIQNGYATQIGDRYGTEMDGYINEVRVWNIARPQDSIKTYMNSSLPNPTTIPGLLGYYTFNSLSNKQGNTAFNGTLSGAAFINATNPNCAFILDSCCTPTSSTIDTSICQGQSYLGYDTTGIYIDTLVNAKGCDSIRTLNLTVKLKSFSTIDTTVCQGENYLGYNITGTYIDTLTNVAGCDSVRTLNLTINNSCTAPTCQGAVVMHGLDKIPLPLPDTSYYSKNGFTWECWFNGSDYQNSNTTIKSQQLLMCSSDIVLCEDIGIGFGWFEGAPANSICFAVDGPGLCANRDNNPCYYIPPGGFLSNTWYHVAGVKNYTTNQTQLYLNGNLVDTKTNTKTPFTRDIFTFLGSEPTGPDSGFVGKMDEIRIWNYPRTAAQINANYNHCLAGNEPGLVTYYHANESSGSILHDVTPNHNDGVLEPTVVWDKADNAPLVNSCGSPSTTTFDTTICTGQSYAGHDSTGTYIDTYANATGCDSLRTLHLTVNNNCRPVPCNNWLNTPTINDYVTVGDLNVVGNKLTIEATFNRTVPLDPSGSYGFLVSKHTNPADNNYSLFPNGCALTTTDNGEVFALQNCSLELNKTYHVAMVYDGTSLKFYRDGYLITQTPATGNVINNALITTIAQNPQAVIYPFLGYMNEVRIWNVARPQDSIRAYMNTSLPNPTTQAGLLGYYTFDNLINKQGNALYNGTIHGAVSINATNPNCTLSNDSCCTPTASIIDTSICQGQSFKGYTTSGNYKDTIPNVAGCDSVITLNLNVILKSFSTTDTSICSGQSFRGHTATGTYIDTLTNVAGCDSIMTLNLTIKPKSFSTIPATICQGQSYLGYTTPGTFVDTLVAANGCDSIRTIDLTVTPYSRSIIPMSICQGQDYFGHTTTGTFVDTLIATHGCDSIRTINLTVNSSSSSIVDTSICPGEASHGYTTAGTYTIILTNAVGCDSTITLNLTVKSLPVVKTINDTSICKGTTFQVRTTGATTYSWSPLISLTFPDNTSDPVINTITPIQYIVTGTTNGCSVNDTLNIGIDPIPVVSKSNDVTICLDSSTRIYANANGGFNFQWSPIGSLNFDHNINDPIAAPLITTTYHVVITDANNCVNSDSIKVTVRPPAIFTISPDANACADVSTQLLAEGGDTYLWSPASLVSNADIRNPTTSITASTTYNVQIKEKTCGTSASLYTTLTLLPGLSVSAGKSNDLDCYTASATLSASGANKYLWSPSGSLNDANISDPIARPFATQKYIVKGTDELGCVGYDSVIVYGNFSDRLVYNMANAFTPNNDGKNDCYGIEYFGPISEFSFIIYNRWGQEMFSTKDPTACWNGTFQGQDVPEDAYVYYVRAVTACGTSEKKGTVVLMR